MMGRLIVAFLVIASAAFVMLQKRETESTDIEADLSGKKAREAEKRADAAELQITKLRDEVSALEAQLAWEHQQLTELAGDCTPTAPEPPSIHVARLAWRAAPTSASVGGQRVGLLLGGDAGTLTRVRLYTSLDDGTPTHDFTACDTLSVDSAVLLGVLAGGKDIVDDFGPQQIEKKRGVVPFELVCDADLDPAQPLSVEVLAAGGASARATIGPQLPRDARRGGRFELPR